MSDMPSPDAFLSTTVALVAGERTRTVTITATTDVRDIPKSPANEPLGTREDPLIASVVEAFLEAVRLGCFKTSGATDVDVVRRDATQRGDLREEAWEVRFPALPVGAFDALVRAAGATAMKDNGPSAFSVVEHAAPDAPRVGRDGLRPLGAERWPFAVHDGLQGDESKDMRVIATFVDDLNDANFESVRALLQEWGKLLEWGAFPPAEYNPYGVGIVADVSRHLPEEVVAEIQFFAGKEEAWNALFRGLVRIHSRAPLASLEIG